MRDRRCWGGCPNGTSDMIQQNVQTPEAESNLLDESFGMLRTVARDLEEAAAERSIEKLEAAIRHLRALAGLIAEAPFGLEATRVYVVEDDAGFRYTFLSRLGSNAFMHVACQFLEQIAGVRVTEPFSGQVHRSPHPHAVFSYGPIRFTVYPADVRPAEGNS